MNPTLQFAGDEVLPIYVPVALPVPAEAPSKPIPETAEELLNENGDPRAAVPELGARDIWVEELHSLTVHELHDRFEQLGIRPNPEKTRHYLVCDLLRAYHKLGYKLLAEGITEFISTDGCGFLRFSRYSFRPGPQDPFFTFQQAKRVKMRGGHLVTVRFRPAEHKEKYFMVEQVLTVEGIPFAEWEPAPDFETLTPRFPDARIRLEGTGRTSVTARAVDLISPIGRGQRGLLVAPPRAGKTILLKELAIAALANNPGLHVMLLLVDERPEEVTDLQRSVKGAEVYASTFDEPSLRHIQVSEILADRAKRLVDPNLARHSPV